MVLSQLNNMKTANSGSRPNKNAQPVAFPAHTDDSGEVKIETDPIHTLCRQHRVQNCQWCRATGGDGYTQIKKAPIARGQ